MASSAATIAFLEDQLSALTVRTAAMFGAFALYCDGKVVGLICGDELYLKPALTDAALLARTTPSPPYPGAKDYHRVPGDALEDREWLQTVVQATADALPPPAPRKPRPAIPNRLPHPRRPRT